MSVGEVGVVWCPGNGCNFYVTMVPVENAEGPSLLKPKGRAAETDGSDRASGGPHPPWARGKARQPGWGTARGARWTRVSLVCVRVLVCVHVSVQGAWRQGDRISWEKRQGALM